jgi:hypothetical protein
MIGKGSSGIGAVSIAATMALSACVSDSLPRDEDDLTDATIGDTKPDAREASSGDAPRSDTVDAAAPQEGSTLDASADLSSEPAIDVSTDMGGMDAGDERGSDTSDVVSVADANDARPADVGVQIDASDAGVPTDARDANPIVDVVDTGTPPIDVVDVAPPPSDASDANSPPDASDGSDTGGDAIVDVTSDPQDAGPVVFYTENFDTGLGGFSGPMTVCGTTSTWSNVSGYAHATEPSTTGVTRISSPAISVPAGATNVTLRMSHKFVLEDGWDAGQLLIGINGATATLVSTFVSGGYTTGCATNSTTCAQSAQSTFPGWSGAQTEEISVADLPTAVGANTVTIVLQILTDQATGGMAGWDINWVTLSATMP